MSGAAASVRAGGATGARPGGFALGAGGLALLVLTALPVFAIGLQELGESWMTPAYTHGPVVVLMALWIGLRRMRDEPAELAALPPRPIWPGVVLVALGLGFGLIGSFGRIADIAAYGIILWVAGVLVVALGWPRARRLWLPVALLVLMLPLPQFFYWKLTTSLQFVASEFATDLIRGMGLSVYLDGNIIDLGVYRLQVAEACAGLQYLFPVISFAVLLAAISREPVWRRLALVAFSVPLAIGMNSIRIAITAWIVNRSGIEAAEGFLHAFEGWAILLASIALLAVFMLLLRFVSGGGGARRLFDLDLSGTGALATRALSARPGRGFIAVAVAGAVASLLVFTLGGPGGPPPARASFDRFPERLGEWTGVRGALDPRVERVIAPDDYLHLTYFSPVGAVPVQIFSSYYIDQTGSAAIHSPEICLPADGWEVSEFGTRPLDMEGTGYGRFDAIRAVITKGTEHQLVYYWFEQRGSRMVNDVAVKFGVLADGITKGRRDGGFVRFVTPIEGENAGAMAEAETRIRALMREALPELQGFIPM
ncbi:VPLPA-CTERM-specific exosortase XrtD [Vannielia litorea]|uniref:VPLPA-CTERM-specific exosortase XrtD n=1 Tax=Vannielia litorea TaxID=1217970 RepID=UPI001C978168|nr:VPLPA-CTERM-specific exosortase XrtD [Vannielia litorea]MBY6155159.1 VPLPA-CTERM-specific exosortase XrtD [Vannielia litorea]